MEVETVETSGVCKVSRSGPVTVVADRGRRKLSVVTNETPEKGRWYLTFTHIERALVATICL